MTWDGQSLGAWTEELEGALALINMTDRSVECRYNARNRKEIMESRVLSTRVLGEVILRTAMVFANEPGGAYEILRRLTRLCLGGKIADGQQYVSWIHEEDFCRTIEWLIDNPNAEGIYNVCAPNPITNTETMSILRRTLGRSVGLPAFRWMVEIGTFFMCTETELVIKSRRVVPEWFLSEGFTFLFPSLESAVQNLEKGVAFD